MALLGFDRINQVMDEAAQRGMRREQLFGDRNNPLHALDDLRLYQRYRLNRQEIFELNGNANC